jgi:hypothetical protein
MRGRRESTKRLEMAGNLCDKATVIQWLCEDTKVPSSKVSLSDTITKQNNHSNKTVS